MASTSHLLLHLVMIIYVIAIQAISFSGYACIEVERKALLAFKADISDGTKHGLSSWDQSEDCCSWRGVTCDNITGNILELNLGNPYNVLDYALSGEINSSLLALNYLTRLDLSNNNFFDISIPEFIGSFKNLMHLNLSNSEFGGKIPHQLGNLSKLQSLDLSSSNFIGTIPPHLGNLSRLQYLSLNGAFCCNRIMTKVDWLSCLTSLKYLDMSYLNLINSADWLQIINKLQSIKVLLMASTYLPNIPSSLSYVNFTGLTTLDLSDNWEFNTTLPSWLWNLTNLSNLNLEACQFFGKIPDDIAKLTSLTYLNFGKIPDDIAKVTSLTYLDFGGNSFKGTLPRSFKKLCNLRGLNLQFVGIGGDIQELMGMLACNWNNMEEIMLSSNNLQGNLSNWLDQMPNLKHLDLSKNSLVGSVSPGIGKLQNLKFLDLSSNSLHGIISEAHFANLTRLKDLYLKNNSLTILVDPNWIPPFQLTTVSLHFCQVGPQFPAWLRWQQHIEKLDLHNTSIADTLPDWLWSLPLIALDLSYNQITGMLPASLPHGLETLVLSNNYISGSLPELLPASIDSLLLSNNMINGTISSSICEAQLSALDLSRNYLSGTFPSCWRNSHLQIMDVSSNNISGEIPPSMGSLTSLVYLDLSNNIFYGELPQEMQYCKYLILLDLHKNIFSGKIPTWIGERFLQLVYLQLSSNKFHGNIPSQLAELSFLQVLDLANNHLSGSLPCSFGNFSTMVYSGHTYDQSGEHELSLDGIDIPIYKIVMDLVMQGKESKYSEILYLVKTMDLSGNNLSGKIPEEIVALQQLNNLNLSRNKLTGKIPEKIGEMLSLECLDLSSNELSGAIPSSLSKLTFLHHLNMSYNNLSGRIPSGNQLDTLDDPSIYIGNFYLCGLPTSKNCFEDQATPTGTLKYANGSETMWLYIGMALGFVVGFWGVYSILLFHGTWRKAYFQMIDNLFDTIYVTVAITVNRLKNKYG